MLGSNILACATRPPAVTAPAPVAKPVATVPAVVAPGGSGVHPLKNPSGPWTFTYTPGTYRYAIVTTAKLALQTDTTVKRDLPMVSEQASITVTKSGDVRVIDPAPSTSVVCDTIAALVTRAQQLLPKVPEQLTADSVWSDSLVTTGCRGSIPTTVKAIYNYTVLHDTLYEGTEALHVKRSDVLTAQGAGSEGQHQISLAASGSGTMDFYLDVTSGLLLGSITNQVTKLDITTSGQTGHFLQYVTEQVALAKTP
jgi:hypothetical protein